MKICIETTSNGAYVKYDDGENEERYSYQFDGDNLDSLQTLVSELIDCLHQSGRYDRFRLYTTIKHGDKYECQRKGCDWCKEDEAHCCSQDDLRNCPNYSEEAEDGGACE
jgi:hypothetical protein